eukprot:TRINITY_DN534_c1_g1_i3.p2 TRINITY_DN534_c1_g1~~TRINITY_DN534_c1_g1_i3.p2  ORF type:complete len:146 (-),score=37.18 TRINITY_DN534_c1_g1_i3:550-987(-)
MGLSSGKNFVTANAVEVILAEPKKKPVAPIDYTHKEDYGRPPKYLTRVKKEIEREYEYIREMNGTDKQKSALPDGMRVLTEEERLSMIEGLKANWDKLNTEYQRLSFTVDTPSKKERKERYEAQLHEIERDIAMLSKKYVYVQAD